MLKFASALAILHCPSFANINADKDRAKAMITDGTEREEEVEMEALSKSCNSMRGDVR